MGPLRPRGILMLCAVTIASAYSFSANITEETFLQFPKNGDTPPPSAGRCSDNEYRLFSRCCQKCPAGTHVSTSCSANHGMGHCRSCTTGKDFTAFTNGLAVCLPCRACAEDEILIEECSVTKNTRCECKPGTYLCQANMNCSEIGTCSPCFSCPEGQRIKHQCNATANTVCEAHMVHELLIAILATCAVTLVICVAAVGFCLWRRAVEGKKFPPKDHDFGERTAQDKHHPDTVFSIPFSDSEQDSIHSHTPLMSDKEYSQSGSIMFTYEDVKDSMFLAPNNSMEWLSKFNYKEETLAASLPGDQHLPAR